MARPAHGGPLAILRFFDFDHLSPTLREVAEPFYWLARSCADTIPVSAELVAGLRKLLEAKDCMVRAALPDDERGNHGAVSEPPSSTSDRS